MAIRIFTTGGTIDKVYFDKQSDYLVGTSRIHAVLSDSNVTIAYEIEPLLQKDSLDLTDADRELIRSRILAAPEERVLITHGTDTMSETGQVLCGIENKVIVLTGAITPARFRDSDAEFNIGFAFAAVQLLPVGVYLTLNGQVFDPRKARKNRKHSRLEEAS